MRARMSHLRDTFIIAAAIHEEYCYTLYGARIPMDEKCGESAELHVKQAVRLAAAVALHDSKIRILKAA